jgi:hypothetical protein
VKTSHIVGGFAMAVGSGGFIVGLSFTPSETAIYAIAALMALGWLAFAWAVARAAAYEQALGSHIEKEQAELRREAAAARFRPQKPSTQIGDLFPGKSPYSGTVH